MRRVHLTLAVATVVLVALLIFTHIRFVWAYIIAVGTLLVFAGAAAALELYVVPRLRPAFARLSAGRHERRLIRSISLHPANKRSAA